jgi:RHS repeat-associated protein
VNLVQSYSPYGEVISSVGDYVTAFNYTGEMTDDTGLVFLRARYYDPGTGRFINKDTWGGDNNNPVTLAKWLYANGNPVIYTDPSGKSAVGVGFTNNHSSYGNSANNLNFETGVTCAYLFAISGKCGCDQQQKAQSMSQTGWNQEIQLDYFLGLAYQFTNDLLLNAPNLIFGNNWQENQSYQFQSGQTTGRQVSNLVGTAATLNGAFNLGMGRASLIPTISGSAACTLVSAGACGIVAAPVVAGEGVFIAAAALESAYGAGIVAINFNNSVNGPKYTANNFRKNLLNRTSIPEGLNKAEAHHVLPEKFRELFAKLGVNVDDPKWGACVEGSGPHQSWSTSYNKEWDNWLKVNINPSISQIEAKAIDLANSYGYTWP